MDDPKPFVVIGVGEVHLDQLPEHGQLGGSPVNVVRHAQALGAKGVLATSAGHDEVGRAILESLQALDLSALIVHDDPNHPTAVVQVALDDHGSPSYTFPQEAAWDYLPFSSECAMLARKAHAICFGSVASRNPYSQDCIRRFLEAALPGCLRVFDVNLRENYYSREVIEVLLEHAEILKLNDDELPIVSGLLNIQGSAKDRMEALLTQFRLGAIALTRGARGSVIMTPDELEVHNGVPVDRVTNTVGASDAFTAALVMGLLRGRPVAEISEHANQLASAVCTQPDVMVARSDAVVAA